MQRKYVYGLLALPVVLFLALLAIMPGETRATFFTEFRHRARLMMGFEPETYSDEQGLRSEHPEEYGHQFDEDGEDSAAEGDDDDDEVGAESHEVEVQAEHGEHAEHSEEDHDESEAGEKSGPSVAESSAAE